MSAAVVPQASAKSLQPQEPDTRIDYDTSYLRPSSSQSDLILVQRHKLTMGKENNISAHFSRFPREARVTTMRASQRNKTADQPLAVCRMTGPMGAWSMQLSGCFNPDGLTSPRPTPDPYPGPPPSASPSSSPPLHRRRCGRRGSSPGRKTKKRSPSLHVCWLMQFGISRFRLHS